MKKIFQQLFSNDKKNLALYMISLSIVTVAVLKGHNTVGLVGARSTDKTLSDYETNKIQEGFKNSNFSEFLNQVTLLTRHSRFNEAKKSLRSRLKHLNADRSISDEERVKIYLNLGEIELRQSHFEKCKRNFEYGFKIARKRKIKTEQEDALRYLFETVRQTHKFSKNPDDRNRCTENFNKYLSYLDELHEEGLSDPKQSLAITNTVKLCLIEFGRFLEVEECVVDSHQ